MSCLPTYKGVRYASLDAIADVLKSEVAPVVAAPVVKTEPVRTQAPQPTTVEQSAAKYGWTAVTNENGDIDLSNRKGKKVVTIRQNKGKYVFYDQEGKKLLSGNKDVAGATEKLLKEYYYAQEVEVTEGTKEPWEMTSEEYFKQEMGDDWNEDGNAAPGGYNHAKWMNLDDLHYLAVKQALSEGKAVPAEVLAEYPELTKKPESKPAKHTGIYDELTSTLGLNEEVEVVGERARKGKIGQAEVIVDIGENPDELIVESIKVDPKNRRKGEATRAIEALTQEADRKSMTVTLRAAPEDTSVASKDLKRFYKKHGFVFKPMTDQGVRKPRKAEYPGTITEGDTQYTVIDGRLHIIAPYSSAKAGITAGKPTPVSDSAMRTKKMQSLLDRWNRTYAPQVAAETTGKTTAKKPVRESGPAPRPAEPEKGKVADNVPRREKSYYVVQGPITDKSYPAGAVKEPYEVSFPDRTYWVVEYAQPLTSKQIKDHKLIPIFTKDETGRIFANGGRVFIVRGVTTNAVLVYDVDLRIGKVMSHAEYNKVISDPNTYLHRGGDMTQLRGDVQHTLDVYNMRSGNPVTIKVVDTIEDFDGNVDEIKMLRASGAYAVIRGDEVTVFMDTLPVEKQTRAGLEEVYKHEIGVHRGIRVMITDEARRKQLFENVLTSLGDGDIDVGRKAALEFISKAQNDGQVFNTTGYEAAENDELAEEYLAYLGQKVITSEDLTPAELSVWEKLKKMISEFIARVTGVNVRLSDQDMIDIVRNAARTVTNMRLESEVDGERRRMLRSARGSNDIFYSDSMRALATVAQDKATPEQWHAMLEKNGAKQAELDWMGWDEFVKDKKSLTRGEIAQWMDANRVEMQEKILGKEMGMDDADVLDESFQNYLDNKITESELKNNGIEIVRDEDGAPYRARFKNDETKYERYQLPGGENYRELLLTMPEQVTKLPPEYEVVKQGEDYFVLKPDGTVLTQSRGRADVEILALQKLNREKPYFVSGHWTQPNILVHVRFNERTDADGRRVLFLEEVQSDWAQKGKKEGFATSQKEKRLNELLSKRPETTTREELEIYNLQNESFTERKVPAMPFPKTDQWVGLAMKRMIRWAADNDFDAIAWTTGEQQAERYDLSKQVTAVNVWKHMDGTWEISAVKDGRSQFQEDGLQKEELEKYIGKELATKAINDIEGSQGKGNHVKYSGLDLKVGGEGMHAFYDQILPAWVSKWGKKYGFSAAKQNLSEKKNVPQYDPKDFSLKVLKESTYTGQRDVDIFYNGEKVSTRYGTRGTDEEVIADQIKSMITSVKSGLIRNPVWVADMTDQLKETARQGLPLFRAATGSASTAGATASQLAEAERLWREKGTDSPYFQKWFKGSKVVDAQGKPLVVYHGTDKQFTVFKGHNYFTTSKPMAAEFSENNKNIAEEYGSLYDGVPHVEEVYLKIENPYIVDDYEDLSSLAYTGEINNLQGKGYDGAMSKNMESIIPFSPTQIKSATGNRGTFSGIDPDIRMLATPNKKMPFVHAKTHQGWEQAQRGKPTTKLDSIRDTLSQFWHVMTRTYKHINPRQHPLFYEALNRYQKAGNIAADKAHISISSIVKGLNRAETKLFNMKVYFDDVVESLELAKQNATLFEIPFGLTEDELIEEVENIEKLMKANPKVADAIQKREDIWDDIRDAYILEAKKLNIGTDHKFLRENYFRHQVLVYADAARRGTGRRVMKKPSPSALKRRDGQYHEYNTNYVEAEFEVMVQLIHATHKMRFLNHIYNEENIIDRLRDEARAELKQQGIDKPTLSEVDDYVKKHLPDGYVYTATGDQTHYLAHAVNDRIADQLLADAAASIGISMEDLHKVMAVASGRKLVIPEAIAMTIQEMEARELQLSWNKISDIAAAPLRYWKMWSLIFPKRFVKYNFRNLTGDMDAMFTWQPGTLLKMKPAAQMLWDAYVKKKVSPEIQYLIDQGQLTSTLQAQEMENLRKVKDFKNFYPEKGFDWNVSKVYWYYAQSVTNFREQIGRVAAYLYYKEQLDKGKKIYGVSRKSVIDQLPTNEMKAYRMANELLGAYDQVSVGARWLSRYAIPFFRFPYTNLQRNFQGIYNTFAHSEGYAKFYGQVLGGLVGRKVVATLVRTPFLAYRAARMLMKLVAFASAFKLWNYLLFDDEERDLPPDIRRKPHIVWGRNQDGSVRYIGNLGVLGDFLEWFGLDETERYIDDLRNGRMNVKEIVLDMLKSPTVKIANGLSPYIKTPVELVNRRTYFPDWTRPRLIRDYGEYVASQWAVTDEYRYFTNLPDRGGARYMQKFFFDVIQPTETAYWTLTSMKYQYWNKIGKEYGQQFSITPKSKALYYYKQALAYGDAESATHYIDEYFLIGGTEEGVSRSLDYLDPLHGLKDEDLDGFKKFVGSDYDRLYKMAYEYHNRVTMLDTELSGKRVNGGGSTNTSIKPKNL